MLAYLMHSILGELQKVRFRCQKKTLNYLYDWGRRIGEDIGTAAILYLANVVGFYAEFEMREKRMIGLTRGRAWKGATSPHRPPCLRGPIHKYDNIQWLMHPVLLCCSALKYVCYSRFPRLAVPGAPVLSLCSRIYARDH